jgi:predicted transcriptional regulator
VRETEKPIAVVARELGIDEGTIRDWLIKDKDAPRKQRHTARRIRQRLVEGKGKGKPRSISQSSTP